jgi:hypothetical protein
VREGVAFRPGRRSGDRVHTSASADAQQAVMKLADEEITRIRPVHRGVKSIKADAA